MPNPIIFEYKGTQYAVSEEKGDLFKEKYPDATTTVDGEEVKAKDYSFGKKEPTAGKQEPEPAEQPAEQPKVQEQSQQVQEPVQQVQEPVQPAEQLQSTEDSYHPSEIEKRQMQANLAAMGARTQGYVSNALETIGNLEDYVKKGGLIGGVKEETVVDPTTMTLQKSYLTPMGVRYDDKQQAEDDTRKDAEWRANQTVSGQLRKIDDDRKRIYDMMNERLKEIEADYKKDEDARSGFVKFLSSVGNASRTGGAKGMSLMGDELQTRINADPEYSRLKTAMNYLDDREALLKREKRREEGKSVGFWRGVGTALLDLSAWDLGFSDLMDQMNLSNTADILEHFDELPDGSAGKEMIRQYILNQQAQEEYGKNDSKMFQYGVMGGQMIPFMVDFAVTFGGFDAINFATKGATKLSTKLIGKAAMGAIAKDGVKAFVKNEGKGAIGKVATNWTVKALGITADELTRGLLMANTVQGMKTASNIVENKRGNAIEEDENGNLRWTGGMSTGEAIWQAEADATIENASEMFGAHLTPIMGKVGEKLSKVIGIKRLSGVLAQSDRAALRNMRKTIKQGFEKLGVSGYLEEVSEEYWGQVEKSILGLNTAYQENEDGTRTNLLANGEFHADIWAGMAYSIGVMNGGQLTMQASWYCNAKHNVNLADRRAGAIWGDQWNKLRQQIDNLTNDQVPAFVQLTATDPNMTDAERGAITDYIWQMLQMRGFNMASEVETREQKPQQETLTPDEIARRVKERAEKPEDPDAPESGAILEEGNTDLAQKAGAAYIDGYDAQDSEEIANSNAMNQQLRERVQQRFGDDVMEDLDKYGVAAVNAMRKQGYSEDDIRLAEEYVISNNVMNGIRQGVFDRTEEEIMANNTRIGQNAKEDGTIQKATLTDGREVYVLAGIIPFNADGTINKNGVIDNREISGVSVRDAKTGEVEMVPLRDITSAEQAQNATDIMEREEREIKERAFEAYNQAIGGTVQATAGATYDITTPDGEGATVEVVPDANGQTETDEGINVSVNGGEQEVMPREELQAGVDAARTEQMASQADESKEPTALEQIPRDENGEPQYEQAESVGVAYRGLVEQCEGDEQMARDVAGEMLEDAKKERDKVKKAKPKTGTTIAEKIQARREQQAAVTAAEEEVAFWKQMTEQPTLEEQAQAQQQAEEEHAKAQSEQTEQTEQTAQTEREEEQQPAEEQTTEEKVQPEQEQQETQPEEEQPKKEAPVEEQTEQTEPVPEKGEGYSITPSQYTKKNGDVLDMQLVTFDDELTSDERKALSSEARNKKGFYDRKSGGFMMRSAEDARALAEKYKSIHKQEQQKQEEEQQRENAAEKETQAAQTEEIPVEETPATEEKPSAQTEDVKEGEEEEQSSGSREVTDNFAEQIERELKELGIPTRVARSAEELVEMAREAGVNIPLEQARRANAFVHDGVVYINAERLTKGRSVEEAMQRGREIVMHEAVAHIGLEKLMGKERFAQFCDAVFKGMDANARDRWKGYFFDNNLNKRRRRELLAKYGAAEDARWDDLTAAQQKRIEEELGDRMRRGAADEYVAKLAERVARGEKLGKQAKSVWQQIVDAVRKLFGLDSKDSGMTEVDIARALAASKQNLKDTERLAEIAEELQSADILRQAELIDERNSIEEAMREREQQRQQTNKEARRERAAAILSTVEGQKRADSGIDTRNSVDDEDLQFSIGRKRKDEMMRRLDKRRGDMSAEQKEALMDYLDTLDNTKLENAAFDWFVKGTIKLPEDMNKVEQAVDVAGKAKVSPADYASPMELLNRHADFKPTRKRINPDDVPTLTGKKDYGNGITVYDVEDSEDGRKDMRAIIDTHWGEDANPWCLLEGDGKGNLTAQSLNYWEHYNAFDKKVAFKDGKLLAFFASDDVPTWWDRNDRSHSGIPVTGKMSNDALGRTATYEYKIPVEDIVGLDDMYTLVDEDPTGDFDKDWKMNYGEVGWGEPQDIHRGNTENGRYEEWWSNGQKREESNFKDGYRNGEYKTWHEDGTLKVQGNFKNGFLEGVYKNYNADGTIKIRSNHKHGVALRTERFYDDGQLERETICDEKGNFKQRKSYYKNSGLEEYTIFDENGVRHNVKYYENGQKSKESTESEMGLIGDYTEWYDNGQVKVSRHYNNTGELEGEARTYSSDGTLTSRKRYKNGEKDGLWEEWNIYGEIEERMRYKNGSKDGIQETYYNRNPFNQEAEPNTLRERIEYKNGEKNGVEERFYGNGNLNYYIEYKDGKKDGVEVTWNYDGTPNTYKEFKDGHMSGLSVSYTDGMWRPLTYWEYKDGKKVGEYSTEDGKKLLAERMKDVEKRIEKAHERMTSQESDMRFSVGEGDERSRGGYQYFTGSIKDLVAKAREGAVGKVKKLISPASSKLVKDLLDKGVRINENYKHVVADSEIRHALAHHGDERERLRGQIPITEEDFEKIPDIVENYDTVEYEGKERDNDVIRYSKAYYDGTVIYLEEVRNGRGELALKTFWKTKGSSKRLGANRTNATQIPSSDETSEGKGSNNSETAKGNGEKDAGDARFSIEEERKAGRQAVEALRKRGVDVVMDAREMERALAEASKEQEDVRYLFTGERGAANIDRAEATTRLQDLDAARRMETDGKDAQKIKAATGWERGADGKWRYETGDFGVNMDALTDKGENDYFTKKRPLKSVITDAEELFSAYPELEKVKVQVAHDDAMRSYVGEYNPKKKMITLRRSSITGDKADALRKILIHEVQHAIQDIEGYAEGGNASMFKDSERKKRLKELEKERKRLEKRADAGEDVQDTLNDVEMEISDLENDTPMDRYSRLSGEVEARNAEWRSNLSAEARRAELAKETEDVSKEDQIMLHNGVFYDANGDVIGNDAVQYLKTADGEIYGFTYKGKVYLDPALLNADTPVHEYTHLWDMAMERDNQALWREGVELMKQTSLWNEVLSDENYSSIAEDESRLASEVHARLSGANGRAYFERLMAEARNANGIFEQAHAIDLLDRLRNWVRRAIQWVKDSVFGKRGMTLQEFVDMPLRDLLDEDTRFSAEEKKSEGAREAEWKNTGDIRFSYGDTDFVDGYKGGKVLRKEIGQKWFDEDVGYIDFTRIGTEEIAKEVKEAFKDRYAGTKIQRKGSFGTGSNYYMLTFPNGNTLWLRISGHTPRSSWDKLNNYKGNGVRWNVRSEGGKQTVHAEVDISRNTMGTDDIIRFADKMAEYDRDGFPQEMITAINESDKETRQQRGIREWVEIAVDSPQAEAAFGVKVEPIRNIEEQKRAELTEELQDARERHDILAQAQAIAELDQMDREQAERDVRFSVSDEVQKSRERMREEHKAAMESKENALERIGGSMRELRDAMRVQRQYDQASVDSLVKLAQEMIGRGMLSEATNGEVKRLLGAVRGGLRGGKGFEESVDKLTDIMISSGLREGKKALSDLCKVRRKTNAAGVAIGGKLDAAGEQMIASFKEAITWDAERIQERMEELQDRIDTDDKAAAEYIGLMLADAYRETVTQREADEAALRDDMDNVPEGLNSEQRREYIRSIEDAIRKSKLDRIEALAKIADLLRRERGVSMSHSAAFRQAEKERVNKIHHMQNSDMEGRKSDEHRRQSLWDRLLNSSLLRFLFSPLATFDYMLRLFGNKNVHGEGYLWNYFMRSYEHAVENETRGMEEATKRLDEMVSNGGLVRWSDLYGLEKRMPRITVSFLDGGEMKEHSLTQGQALYIYMVNKMDDGAMKLRAMGITAEEVERIADEIDSNFIQLADWIQDVFLPDMRKKYNAVYERLFGTSMDEIANYFPLKILSDARMEEVDVSEEGNNKGGARMPSTVTGSIVRRKRNTTALDLLGADAFSVVIEHLQQMEHWAAFAEFNRDVNTMLSYKRFKNQVKNMKSIYGSGNTLWKNFKNVCSIAAGTYTPTVGRDSIDTAAVNIAKGVTAAKIAYRLYTAVKQLLSLPAFFSDVSTVSIAKSMATPSASWNWAMENLPMFRKRWLSRQVGDTRLMDTDLDWRFWKNNIISKLGRWGMTPNAFIDALTISIGAKAVYDTRFNQYIKDGYSEEDAKKRAAEDAAVVYNESQQSNENGFLSAIQLDRTVASVSLSVFRNSSMGYERRFLQSVRNLGRLFKDKDFKEKSIAFMTKQGVRNGLTEEQAERAARKEFARGMRRDAARLAIFGFVVQFAWNLGGYLPYLFMGGSGDDKKKLAEDAAQHALFGSIEGLAGGSIYSEVGNMLLNGENVSNYDPTTLPVMSDIRNLLRTMNRDEIQGMNDMVNLFIQAGLGVNPQTVEDAVVAIIDACGGDMDTGREVVLLLSRIMQVPQSQLDMLYFDNLDLWGDEAKGMLPSELAERYAKYKVMRGSALTRVAYSQEGMEQALDRWREKARQKEKALLYAGDGGEEDQIYQMLGDEAKEVSKEIRKINKIKESDPTTYKNRMKELAATDRYKHYRLYKECTGVMDKYAKRWLDAQTKEEKDAAQEAVNDLKVRMAVKLDEMEKKEN